jgi:hypothetical protein
MYFYYKKYVLVKLCYKFMELIYACGDSPPFN